MNHIDLSEVFFISHTDADGYMSMVNMLDAIIGINNIEEERKTGKINSTKYNAISTLDDPSLFLNINYPLNFPIDKVPEGKIVFISDMSFTEEQYHNLKAIADKSKYVVWTDHHKSSMWYIDYEGKESVEKIIPILFDGSSSSMTTHFMNNYFKVFMLTKIINRDIPYHCEDEITNDEWSNFIKNAFTRYMYNLYRKGSKQSPESVLLKFIYDDFETLIYKNKEPKKDVYIKPYEFITLIDDYDIWKHEFADTLAFHYGLDMYNNSVYYSLLKQEYEEKDSIKLDIFDDGEVIKRYVNIQNDYLSNKQTFVKKFFYDEKHGMVDVLCCNSRGNSFVFGDKLSEYPFCLLYHYNGTEWKYSIYCHKKYLSQGYDASIIAKDFGGGGHAGASGFSSVQLISQLL